MMYMYNIVAIYNTVQNKQEFKSHSTYQPA